MNISGALLLIAAFRIIKAESRRFPNEEQQFDPGKGKRCPYEVLGLSKTASTRDVRRSFLALSKKYHPDVSKEEGASERFKEINEAYSILNNAERRKAYDEGGFAELFRMSQNEGGGQGYDVHDIFSNFFWFGGNRQREEDMKDESLVYTLDLPPEAFEKGMDVELQLRVRRLCKKYDECEVERRDCADLNVKTVVVQHGRNMFFHQQIHDPTCIGRYKGFKPDCKACPKGATYMEDMTIDLNVEPGYRHGQKIVLQGRGQEKPGFKRGDIVFVVNQPSYPQETRDRDDIRSNLNILLNEAFFGFNSNVFHFGDSF